MSDWSRIARLRIDLLETDPAVRALLDLVADDPERALRVLGTTPAAA